MNGYIYFIAAVGMDAVKIGFTEGKPLDRLSKLQTGCPAELKLLAFVPGSTNEERGLHETFNESHLRGEWFALSGRLKHFLAHMWPDPDEQPYPMMLHFRPLKGAFVDRWCFEALVQNLLGYPHWFAFSKESARKRQAEEHRLPRQMAVA